MALLNSLPKELHSELRRYTQKEREEFLKEYLQMLDHEYDEMLRVWQAADAERFGSFIISLPFTGFGSILCMNGRNLFIQGVGGLIFTLGATLLGYSVSYGPYLRYRKAQLKLSLIKLKHGA